MSLAGKLGAKGLVAVSIHPGVIMGTGLAVDVLETESNLKSLSESVPLTNSERVRLMLLAL